MNMMYIFFGFGTKLYTTVTVIRREREEGVVIRAVDNIPP